MINAEHAERAEKTAKRCHEGTKATKNLSWRSKISVGSALNVVLTQEKDADGNLRDVHFQRSTRTGLESLDGSRGVVVVHSRLRTIRTVRRRSLYGDVDGRHRGDHRHLFRYRPTRGPEAAHIIPVSSRGTGTARFREGQFGGSSEGRRRRH